MAERTIWVHLILAMPDHLHMLCNFDDNAGMKKTISSFKRYAASNCGTAWQRDFFDHRIRSYESFEGKAIYIRENPLRAGLVSKAGDWPYVRNWRDPQNT